MNAKYCKNLVLYLSGLALLATQSAWAGPLPLDQLVVWLRDTQSKLASTQKTILELESQILVAEKTVANMTTAVRDGKTPDTAMNGDNAGGYELIGVSAFSPISSTEATLREARARLADLRRNLVKAIGDRKVLKNDLESILVQIAAWKEIMGSGIE